MLVSLDRLIMRQNHKQRPEVLAMDGETPTYPSTASFCFIVGHCCAPTGRSNTPNRQVPNQRYRYQR